MKIERFEDVKAWQTARELAKMVYEVTSSGTFARDFRPKDQIRDAAGSVMHNIATGIWQIWSYPLIERRFTQKNADKSRKISENQR